MDTAHDLLSLWQGNQVVEQYNVHVSGGPIFAVQSNNFGSAGSQVWIETGKPNGFYQGSIFPHV